MILRSLLEFAKERGLKRADDTVFGVINGQLVAISRTHHEMHRIQATLLEPVPQLRERLRSSSVLTKVVRKGWIQVDANAGTVAVSIPRRAASKTDNLIAVVTVFTQELSKLYQPQFDGEVVL